MHAPSLDELTASVLKMLISIPVIGPLCSLRTFNSSCFWGSNDHTRTCPSHPPLIILVPSDVTDKADTPLLWALSIANIKRPVIGVNPRIIPSFQP